MKRAAFRLQPVLELRRSQERAAAMAAAEAARTADDADRRATEREHALAASVPPSSATADAFLAAMARQHMVALDASEARSFAIASAEQAEAVRAEWTAAAQRTKALERLRERHLLALRQAELAAEERAVDDLVTGRAGRRPAEELPWTG
jgi:flagellar FliJ protein